MYIILGFDSAESSNSFFSKTTWFNSFIKASVENLLLDEDFLNEKPSMFFSASESWKAQNGKKKLSLKADLGFQAHDTAEASAWLFASRVQPRVLYSRKSIQWKICDFPSFVGIQIVQRTQKNALGLDKF